MIIRLQVTSGQALGDSAQKSFDHHGGSFGRASHNAWVLPDESKTVSGQHGMIYFEGGKFYLTDISSNGIFVNGSESPLGKGNVIALRDGDLLRFGAYEVKVSGPVVEDSMMPDQQSAAAESSPAQIESEPASFDASPSDIESTNFDLLTTGTIGSNESTAGSLESTANPFSSNSHSDNPGVLNTGCKHSSPMNDLLTNGQNEVSGTSSDDPFASNDNDRTVVRPMPGARRSVPAVGSDPARSTPTGQNQGSEIPEDWDLTGFSKSEGDADLSPVAGAKPAQFIPEDIPLFDEPGVDDLVEVAFTASYPPAIESDTWYHCHFFVHLEHLRDEVIAIITHGAESQVITTSPATRLERGSKLRVVFELGGCVCETNMIEFTWGENIHEFKFRFKALKTSIDERVTGNIDVYASGALIAWIPVATRVVSPKSSELRSKTQRETAKMVSSIFASYSLKDSTIVDACVEAYRALGIEVFIDRKNLQCGDKFDQVLFELIERADLFQLYWSQNSMDSDWVQREWTHAYKLSTQAGRKHASFIRPCVWDDTAPSLPDKLKSIQSSTLDLRSLGLVKFYEPGSNEAFMQGLGLPLASLNPRQNPAQVMTTTGRLFREVIQGLMILLQARSELKNQFRTSATTIRPTENNPLKFSPNVDEALKALFAVERTGYLQSDEAMKEGIRDIRNHQMAMIAGMQSAFTTLLQRLNPDQFSADSKEGGVKAFLSSGGKKSRSWEQYCAYYDNIVVKSGSAFQLLFGEDFSKAYEEQLRILESSVE